MTFRPEHFTVWAEIPVTDMERAIDFYQQVFKTELEFCEEGPRPAAMFRTTEMEGVAGNLYAGTPAADGAGPTIHLACPDTLEDSLERLKQAGGKVVSDIVTIPTGRFAYCTDLDGNSIGLYAA